MPDPFFVLATQNPIEQEGTYPLPEAQLDRFLFKVFVGYPSREEERAIYRRTTGRDGERVTSVLSIDEILQLQSLVRSVPITDFCVDYAMALVRSTRPQEPGAPDYVTRWIAWGAGPRAGQAMILAAKRGAALAGRPLVSLEDLRTVAEPALRHRLVTTYTAQAEGQTPERIIRRLLADIPTLPNSEAVHGQVAQVLRS